MVSGLGTQQSTTGEEGSHTMGHAQRLLSRQAWPERTRGRLAGPDYAISGDGAVVWISRLLRKRGARKSQSNGAQFAEAEGKGQILKPKRAKVSSWKTQPALKTPKSPTKFHALKATGLRPNAGQHGAAAIVIPGMLLLLECDGRTSSRGASGIRVAGCYCCGFEEDDRKL